MIDDIIQDITLAKNNNAYLSALSLALTLPNILSNIEHGRETHKAEYIDWFNNWVYKHYKHPESKNPLINKGIDATKFDGENCYLLRCALLHSGNTNLKDAKGNMKINSFELCVSKFSSHFGDAAVCDVSNDSASNVWVSINVIGLIEALIEGANEYIAKNNEKVLQQRSNAKCNEMFGSIRIIDFEANPKAKRTAE